MFSEMSKTADISYAKSHCVFGPIKDGIPISFPKSIGVAVGYLLGIGNERSFSLMAFASDPPDWVIATGKGFHRQAG